MKHVIVATDKKLGHQRIFEFDGELFGGRLVVEEKTGPWNDPSIHWVCEAHPDKDFEHRLWFGLGPVCAGPGMPCQASHN